MSHLDQRELDLDLYDIWRHLEQVKNGIKKAQKDKVGEPASEAMEAALLQLEVAQITTERLIHTNMQSMLTVA